MKASNATAALFNGIATPSQQSRSIGVFFQLMRVFASLATLVYLAVMFAFVGAVVGFFVGFVGVLRFDVDFASLPLFGAGGAVGFALWAFPRACSGDTAASTGVEATPHDNDWTTEIHVEHAPVVFDRALDPFVAVTFVESSSTTDCFGQPRLMIDAFTFGDNLYEAIHERTA